MGTWNENDRNVVRTQWARGVQSREIVPLLSDGISRNAVMGMLNRMGLMGLGHADDTRLAAIAKVEEVMDAPFFLGEALHCEALLALCVDWRDRTADALALASGISRDHCAAFLDRLPLVWPEGGRMPARWQGSLEGTLAFILDMAVVRGMIHDLPVRRGPSSVPRLAA